MITDTNLRVSSAQAVTTTAVSTNTIDLALARDIGKGAKLRFAISVDTAATAAGAATVTFQAITSTSAALTSPTIVGSTDAIGKAALTASVANGGLPGKRIIVEINPQLATTGQRYLGLQYTVATGPLTAGAFTADLVLEYGDGQTYYASGFTVS